MYLTALTLAMIYLLKNIYLAMIIALYISSESVSLESWWVKIQYGRNLLALFH
jgi:hypothetical protein